MSLEVYLLFIVTFISKAGIDLRDKQDARRLERLLRELSAIRSDNVTLMRIYSKIKIRVFLYCSRIIDYS